MSLKFYQIWVRKKQIYWYSQMKSTQWRAFYGTVWMKNGLESNKEKIQKKKKKKGKKETKEEMINLWMKKIQSMRYLSARKSKIILMKRKSGRYTGKLAMLKVWNWRIFFFLKIHLMNHLKYLRKCCPKIVSLRIFKDMIYSRIALHILQV